MNDGMNHLHMTRRAFVGAAAGACLGAGGLRAAAATGGTTAARPRVRPLPSDGKTPIPLLGLGSAERFPLKTRAGEGAADLAYAERMVDEALARGVNWIDTGYIYHKGMSEPFLGRVLKKYPRDAFLESPILCPMHLQVVFMWRGISQRTCKGQS